MRALAVMIALLLAGCTTTEPKVRTVSVLTPVRMPCVPGTVPAAPSYADANLPAGPDAAPERYQLTAAANLQRKARLDILEPVISSCR